MEFREWDSNYNFRELPKILKVTLDPELEKLWPEFYNYLLFFNDYVVCEESQNWKYIFSLINNIYEKYKVIFSNFNKIIINYTTLNKMEIVNNIENENFNFPFNNDIVLGEKDHLDTRNTQKNTSGIFEGLKIENIEKLNTILATLNNYKLLFFNECWNVIFRGW